MWAHENPFRSSRIDKLAFRFKPGWGWKRFLGNLQENNYRGAIVGPKGHGKSTLLRELHSRLEHSEYHKISLDEPFPKINDKSAIVILDGPICLARWLTLKATIKRLIISEHQPSRLKTLYKCETDCKLLDGLLEELKVSIPTTQNLLTKHSGNVREIFFCLYRESAETHTR